MAKKEKIDALTPKQRQAVELLTCGEGLLYKDICERVGINARTLYEWRTSPDFLRFQSEVKRLNDERWLATVDAARQAAFRLVENDNQRMVEFVLKNEGYNPAQKIEAEVNQEINIEITE